ncbi:MAG: hypothetical protein FWD60_12480 [Candidatus Azobacteroides sp.]|nr:hypothetical protein [Candidatus Azobacteroides sp.]
MKYLLISFSILLSLRAQGQDLDVESNKLTPFIQALYFFSKNIPREKVYLHFDNTSYYQGDDIWFKCYVTSGQNQLSQLSKTLYVELLNPGGEIIDKQILSIENGQCHGDFSLNRLPFYSGFYEVRAYTKYMLNFGEDVIFSRLLPVFDKPKAEGNYEEKQMLKYGRQVIEGYPMKRESPKKGNNVNIRFFPEGGNLIQGIASRVAFEATDETGNPIDVTGVVLDEKKQELCRFSSFYEGRGTFTCTPGIGKQKVEVEYSGKKYQFDLPAVLLQGVVMEVDNLSYPDSIGITLRKSELVPAEMLGLAVLNEGIFQNYQFVYMEGGETDFKIDKTKLPSGVSQIVLFNNKGDILCDRLVFTGKDDFLNIKTTTDKSAYKPYEPINMEISVADKQANPVQTTFSLSVRDAANEVEYKQNILTDLLLMSEIKGYVRNPSYYFESEDSIHRAALDQLLMVQGWRRYAWKQMAGIDSLELKYFPEQGIEIAGKVVSLLRQIPKSNVDVSLLLLQKKEENELPASIAGSSITDNQGRFSFTSDVHGKWNMILKVTEKGKRKDHLILLDRIFSPESKRYRYADLQININGKNTENENDEEMPDSLNEDSDSFFDVFQDSLIKVGTTKKIHSLPEVVVKAKKNTNEEDIRRNRSTSIAYYDVTSKMDDFYDKGILINDNIDQLLINMNKDFRIVNNPYNQRLGESLLYKTKNALVVVNYQPVLWRTPDLFNYQDIDVSAVKSIYINENPYVISQYIISNDIMHISPAELAMKLCKCVVFIETYPEREIPVEGAKGVRKTWLDGYSDVKEFYSPDYSALPEESDYRRTLYWNPAITTDSTGIAKIQFYNNSSCKKLSINAETVTAGGKIGVN